MFEYNNDNGELKFEGIYILKSIVASTTSSQNARNFFKGGHDYSIKKDILEQIEIQNFTKFGRGHDKRGTRQYILR